MRIGKILLGWQYRHRKRRLSRRESDRIVKWIALGSKTARVGRGAVPQSREIGNGNVVSLSSRRTV